MSASQETVEFYDAAIQTAIAAGKIARKGAEASIAISQKDSYADLVTETDRSVESFIIGSLKEKFPAHSFIGEESTADGAKCLLTDNPTWLIDPIDGTTNFVHGYPYYAVSIGLYVNQKPLIGLVYNVPQDKVYSAIAGQGAYCNGRRIHARRTEDLSSALIITEFGSSRDPDFTKFKLRNMENIIMKAHGIRCAGSAALNLCAVAAGEADAYFEFGIHCWDMAAGGLIAQEAGAVVVDTEGGPLDVMQRRVLCATSTGLATAVSSTISHWVLPSD